jgi:uncharacterized repeat protein (TIGR01451 family)
MKKQVSMVVILAALLMPVVAVANPLVSVRVVAEKEVTTVLKSGERVKKRVAVTKISPDDVIFYTVHYVNSGDTAATNAVVEDPIPSGTVYLPGSAYGDGAEITFSIDGGKTFKKPSLFTYEVTLPNGKTENRVASPEEYTTVRWVIDKIDAGAKGSVGFCVKVRKQ